MIDIYRLPNGTPGIKLDISYSERTQSAVASLPGHGLICVFPSEAIDAVLMASGDVAYVIPGGEVRIPDHRVPDGAKIFAQAHAEAKARRADIIDVTTLDAAEKKYIRRHAIAEPGENIPDALVRSIANLALRSVPPGEKERLFENRPTQQTTTSLDPAEIRAAVARAVQDVFQREILPLFKLLELQSKLNGRLSAQLSDLQRTLAQQGQTVSPTNADPAPGLTDEGTETFDVSFSDRAGVQTPFSSLDNPFSAPNPHRR